MEGVLWKWTNYWNGWQPRWFVLDGPGILAYYKSQEEVNQGCKGSVKLSACEIIVHHTDQRRLDLVIPSEQHFFLRASSSAERQQWLVALGSAKAAFSSQQKSPKGDAGPDGLKLKKSELRLYCDLLMQQVHTIKSSMTSKKNIPDIQKMDDAAELLTATCDTFIKTLDDCMSLAKANMTFELPHQHVRDSALPSEDSFTLSPPIVPASLQQAIRRQQGFLVSLVHKRFLKGVVPLFSIHIPQLKSDFGPDHLQGFCLQKCLIFFHFDKSVTF